MFEREEDARKVLEVLIKRFAKYGLRLHPDKTRIVPFTRPSRADRNGKGPGTFDFLGFTHYWRRVRSGRWMPWAKTRKARVRRFTKNVTEWLRRHRHLPVQEQHAALTQRIAGHFKYFGVNGNVSSLSHVLRACEKIWHKWLNRRSQRARKSWGDFVALKRWWPLPRAKVLTKLWQTSP
jgi:hypothetical protein